MASAIQGILWIENRPFPDQNMLLISEDMARLLGVSITDSDGAFYFDPPPPKKRAILLAKVKGAVVTLLYDIITIPQMTPLHLHVDFQNTWAIEGRIVSHVGRPPFLNIFLDPVKVEGVPDQLGHFFYQKKEGVFDNHFMQLPVEGDTFTFRVKSGTYRLGGEYINYDRPMLVNPDFQNYLVEQVSVGSTVLPGGSYNGFTLDVTSDCQVILSLRIVEDSEL